MVIRLFYCTTLKTPTPSRLLSTSLHLLLLISTSRPRCPAILQTQEWRRVLLSSAGPWRLTDDIIPAGPAGPQVLLVDGFDRQRDRVSHDSHSALPVSPQTSLGSPQFEGPADWCWYTESGGRLQSVWCDLLGEKTSREVVGEKEERVRTGQYGRATRQPASNE